MNRQGFTLIELLLACAVVGVIAALAIPAITAARSNAERTQCASNLRQIGLALQLYANDHAGFFPPTTHSLNSLHRDEAWIYGLADYLQNMDRVRVCPADPPVRQRQVIDRKATSYALNELVFDSEDYNQLLRIPRPSQTLLAVILSENRTPSPSWDHVHSSQWTSWLTMLNDVEVDRHIAGGRARLAADRTKGSANYLYADGHVENIAASTMKKILDSGQNPAVVPPS